MPCVNLAINAGQGIHFRLNEALNFASAGDVIVLTIEYYELSMKPSGYITARTFAASPASLPFAGFDEIRATLDDGLLELLAHRTRNAVRHLICGKVNPRAVYDKRNFDESGDFVGHLELPPPDHRNWGLGIAADPQPALNQMRWFLNRCEESGVRVYYRLPCIPRSLAEKQIDRLNEIERALIQMFGSNMLNRSDETFLPDDAFFDTSYHLIGSEGQRQSQILATRLAEKLIRQ
jgi:hypothetical protein